MIIPGFDIIAKLKEDAYTASYKAEQLSLHRIVTLKIIKSEYCPSSAELASLVEEGRRIANLKHPNIVQVYDIANSGNIHYLVMEYVKGPTVMQSINADGLINYKSALNIAINCAEAMRFAWDRMHLIHRNLKPDNIILDEDHDVKIDFIGLSTTAEESMPKSGLDVIEGTPYYMSPEQASGNVQLDFRTDMYSLGATLYHMITGQMPFKDQEPMKAAECQSTDQLKNPREFNPDLPISLIRIMTTLMMKNRRDRYRKWNEAIAEMKKTEKGRIIVAKHDQHAFSTIQTIESKVSSDERSKTSALPAWLVPLAWIALLIWWILLANTQLRPFFNLRALRRDTMQTIPAPINTTVTQQKTALVYDKNLFLRSLQSPEPESTKSFSDTDNNLYDAVNRFGQIKRTIAKALLMERFDNALTAIKQNRNLFTADDNIKAQFKELADFVPRVTELNTAIANSLGKHAGGEVIIHHGNQDRTIIIQAVSGTKLNAIPKKNDGTPDYGNNVTIDVSQLEPLERIRWLDDSDTPVINAMKTILYTRAKDYYLAEKFAAVSGPLADTFTEIIQNR